MSAARAVVKNSSMNPAMQEAAILAAQDAISNYATEQEIASAIKTKFEHQFPSTWHCFIGRNFASYVTHDANKFTYFYVGQVGVCLFATA